MREHAHTGRQTDRQRGREREREQMVNDIMRDPRALQEGTKTVQARGLALPLGRGAVRPRAKQVTERARYD
eukprot:3980516-Pyramimonas_sp.AAC.1